MINENINDAEKSKTTDQDLIREQKELLSKSELSIWLDSYDDIFSDFDSRPISERALSDDFIHESRKMAKEKLSGSIELKLLMPDKQRVKSTEEIIIKSLHLHFRRFAHQLQTEMRNSKKRGYFLCAIGFTIMITAIFIATFEEKNFLLKAFRIILEPAGWFFVWTGFEHIFYLPNLKKSEYNFMNRMAHAEINFLSF